MAYTLEGHKGGLVKFMPFDNGTVQKESISYSSTVTNNPIEQGAEINDHVNNNSETLTISGVVLGQNDVQNLILLRNNREIITYTGRIKVDNLVFTSLKFDRSSKNATGASFTATFKRVQTTVPDYVMDAVQKMSQQDKGKNDNQQLKETTNKGTTTTSVESVSSASKTKYDAVTPSEASTAPLTRQTGAYDGLSKAVV